MLKQISIDELEPGMYVEKVDRSWVEIPFFKKNIKTSQQVEKLRNYDVRTLHIDTEKGKDLLPQEDSTPLPPVDLQKESVPSEVNPKTLGSESPKILAGEEVGICEALHKQAIQCVREIYKNVSAGAPPDIDGAQEVVDNLVNNMGRYRDVLISLSKLKAFDDYTFTHSVNVAIFSITLGEGLHYPAQELKALGLGAIFHDIGKTRIPKEILNRPGPLTPDEVPVIQKHPQEGMELLKETPGVNTDILRVPLEHHERISGSGYPRGLKGSKISEFGMIASIADVYDAMTSDRVYHSKMPPHTALSKIYAMGKESFNIGFIEKFISRIGVYPIGSLLILSSGEVGVVTEIRRDQLLRPQILLIKDQEGLLMDSPEIIDLLHEKKKRRIVGVTTPENVGINLEDFL